MVKSRIDILPAVIWRPPSVDEPREKPFPTPSEVKMESGFGASQADLRRGFLEPDVQELPKYDKENYEDRATLPRSPEKDDAQSFPEDMDFRMKGRETPGLLRRPRIPTER